MAQKAKFLFDFSFDDRADIDRAAAAAAAAKEAERKAELDAAYARGHEAGIAEAAAGVNQRIANAVAAMTEQLAAVERARAEIEQATTEAAIRVALAVLRKILPSIERRDALPEIEAVFAECLPRAIDEPRIVFRVPDALLDALKGRVDEVAQRAGFRGKVVLLSDDGLGASDCRIEWADGGAERSVDRIWKDVEELVGRVLNEPREPLSATAAPAAAAVN